MRMIEDFLYYLWQMKLLSGDLVTSDNQVVKVISTGERNLDSGPDFFNARVRIGNTEWAGNVEMHIAASDWLKHGHHQDKAYDSVILHVVYDADTDIYNSHNELIPVVSVKGNFSEYLFHRYKQLIGSREWIPCAKVVGEVSDLTVYAWLDRVLVERLERKTEFLEKILSDTANHWEEAFYISLCRSFGFNTNAQPFEQLAHSLPISVLNKHKDNIFQIEALLYGQAGMLNPRMKDDYAQSLLKEYSFLSAKYQIEAGKSWAWKFMRMRPVNFPSIRISQFAQLANKSGHLLSKILEMNKLEKLVDLFDVEVSDYWLTHYTFGKVSKQRKKSLGRDSIDLILINTIVPFLFVYGSHHHEPEYIDRALLFLQQTKAESNGVVRRWASSGVKANHAGHSQALLTLRHDYCTRIKCLECAIGNKIIHGN